MYELRGKLKEANVTIQLSHKPLLLYRDTIEESNCAAEEEVCLLAENQVIILLYAYGGFILSSFYQTGRRIIPAFEKRAKIETFVPDSSVQEIVNDLIGSIGSGSEPCGMVFVKEVSEAYEIGSKQCGEAILTAK